MNRHGACRLAAAIACIALSADVAAEAAAEARTGRAECDGRTATIVGRGEYSNLRGTDGPDVIVSRGGIVDAGSGNDLICVSGPASVEAGDGNDRVLVTTKRLQQTSVSLGLGRDSMRSQSGIEKVAIDGADEVFTGAGDDASFLSFGGRPFNGRVNLGPGHDQFAAASYDKVGVSARIDGGDDRDELLLTELGGEQSDPTDVVVDNKRHTATQGAGSPFLVGWSSFELFHPFSYIPENGDAYFNLRFIGSPASEILDARLASEVHATMSGGRDAITVGTFGLVDGSVFSGGGQRGDRFTINLNDSSLAINLTTGEATNTSSGLLGSTSSNADIRGFTTLKASNDSVRITGSSRTEAIRVHACTTQVFGAGGDDFIKFHGLGPNSCPDGLPSPTLNGGPGNDVLTGSNATDDTLVGGRGNDSGDGREGRDRCETERKRRCEA